MSVGANSINLFLPFSSKVLVYDKLVAQHWSPLQDVAIDLILLLGVYDFLGNLCIQYFSMAFRIG